MRPGADGEAAAPWSVEVPESKLKLLGGADGSILQRLGRALGCRLEVKQEKGKGKGKGLKAISYGGQTQYLDDPDAGKREASVKIFIQGSAEKRRLAAEAILGVANGQDAQEHCALAEGGVIVDHEIIHPDSLAWVRWRLAAVAHDHAVQATVGQKTVVLHAQGGGPLEGGASHAATGAVEAVIAEADKLAEIIVDAKDEFEPEDAPSHGAVQPLVEQYGVMVRVTDPGENEVTTVMHVRVTGPRDAAEDTAAVLRQVFVQGQATATVLQAPGQVQAMPPSMASQFKSDLQEFESECGVKVHLGKVALWISGDEGEKVGDAIKTLQEMIHFYLPAAAVLLEDLDSALVGSLMEDAAVGALMARPSCVLQVDELERTAWLCGNIGELQKRVNELAQAVAASTGEPPQPKRRRIAALTAASEAIELGGGEPEAEG